MNYEEMLNAKDGGSAHASRMPFGNLVKKQIDGKYRYVVELHRDLMERPGFMEALQTDQQLAMSLKSRGQARFIVEQNGETPRLELELGHYHTLDQLLNDNPAIVAHSGFIDTVVAGLLDVLEELHQHSAYYLCLSPRNVLVRKADSEPLLLLHASAFARSVGSSQLFADMESFVAPEVLAGQEPTASSDIFSLGRLIECLYQNAKMPMEYKQVVKKATQQEPSKRYASIADMRAGLKGLRNTKQSLVMFLSAVAVALVCVWLYFELVPTAENIEFVEGVPTEAEESLLDEGGYYPGSDSDEWSDSDSIDVSAMEERLSMDAYMKKAEDIFRKRFTQEADRILSKVYNNSNMNASEKTFIASTNVMHDELLKAQSELTEQTGISDQSAERIAMEVIDRLTYEKQKTLTKSATAPQNEEE